MSGGRGRALAATGGVLGGLLVGGGGAGTWRTLEEVRQVGGVRVAETAAVPGAELAPTVVAWGIGLVIAGLVLLLLRGPAVRVGAAALGLVAVGAGIAVVIGLVRAAGGGGAGTLGSGGPITAGGVLVALAGAAAGLARARGGRERALPARYDLEADPADDAAAAWDDVSVEDRTGRPGL